MLQKCTQYYKFKSLVDLAKLLRLEGDYMKLMKKTQRADLLKLYDFNSYIRQHWGVENSLHYVLDVTFNEDQQRKRIKNAVQNLSIMQKVALNLLKNVVLP